MLLLASRWQRPPETLTLQPEAIHLWRFRLDLPTSKIKRLKTILSDDEIVRAERLLSKSKQHQFIVARATLRVLLGRYLRQEPGLLRFRYEKHGKPTLGENSQVFFNLAHSGELALVGFTGNGELGVDLEKIDSSLEYLRLAERYFTDDEQKILRNATETRQRRIFFRLWTQKESELKRIGSGFSVPLNQSIKNLTSRRKTLPIGKGYVGSVSAPATVTSIVKYQITESA